MKEVDTSGAGAHPNWPDRFFAQIVNAYLAKTHNRGGRVGHAHCFLFDAKGLLALALDEMRTVAWRNEVPAGLPSRREYCQQTFPAEFRQSHYQEYLGMIDHAADLDQDA